MSNNKPITVAEAARLFGFVAAAMVIVLLAISMEGEPAPVRPAWTLSEGLQSALGLLGLSVVAVVGLVAFLGLVARRSARTADTPREGNGLQAQLHVMRAERDKAEWERDELNRRVKELERYAAVRDADYGRLHSQNRQLKDEYAKAIAQRDELERAAAMHHQAMLNQRAELEQARTQIPLGIQQAAAIIDMIATEHTPAVRRVIPFLRELGIPVTKAGYEALSAAVHRLRAPSPTEQAQPVRDATTEKKPANARRERANGRTRTHPRTRKQ